MHLITANYWELEGEKMYKCQVEHGTSSRHFASHFYGLSYGRVSIPATKRPVFMDCMDQGLCMSESSKSQRQYAFIFSGPCLPSPVSKGEIHGFFSIHNAASEAIKQKHMPNISKDTRQEADEENE